MLLGIVTTQLGADGAGVFLVAIALFNIMSKVCEFGSATGLIRTISRDRALGKQHELRANTKVAVAMSFGASVIAALGTYFFAPALADIFASGKDVATVTDVLRAISPFVAFSSVYSVLCYGTRGFNTMVPQVCIEKIGRALAQPIAVLAVLLLGGGVVAATYAWAAVQMVWVIPAGIAYFHLLRRVERETTEKRAHVSMAIARSFTSYSLPRALGPGLPGRGVVDGHADHLGHPRHHRRRHLRGGNPLSAHRFVHRPRRSCRSSGRGSAALLALRKRIEAARLYSIGAAWQTALTWSVYLIVIFFSTPLLRLFGPQYVAAGPALVWLAFAMLISSLFGPSDTIILMSGRSRLSLFNAFVAVGINVVGNFLLVPHFGITAAGATWAVTIVIAAALPAYQARRDLGVHPWSGAVRAAMVCAVLGVGVPVVVSWLVLGPTAAGVVTATVVGAIGFVVALRRFGAEVHLDTLIGSLLPSGRNRVSVGVVGSTGTMS